MKPLVPDKVARMPMKRMIIILIALSALMLGGCVIEGVNSMLDGFKNPTFAPTYDRDEAPPSERQFDGGP
jgi:PBP1b-binding outer membrane lipoprotein LpoB